MNLPEFFDPAHCPLCGQANQCLLSSPAAYKGPCWCTREEFPAELLARVPEPLRNRACICRDCLEKFRMEKLLSIPRPPHAARKSPAFTLLALLVVVAVISFLAPILLPILGTSPV